MFLRAFLLTAFCLSLTACATPEGIHDPWFGRDKGLHFFGSAALGGGATAAALAGDASDSQAGLVAAAVVIPIGLGKEAYDEKVKGTHWSWRDFVWDLVGGTAGYLLAVQAD